MKKISHFKKIEEVFNVSKYFYKNKLISVLLIIYLMILTWIILFKMQFNLTALPYIRFINLIPFKESVISNGKIYLGEIFNNFLVFIPVGVYISMLRKEKSILRNIIPIFLLTLSYEIIQFIFHIGATDITDIIMNTLGGLFGVIFTFILYKIFKNDKVIDIVLKGIALFCTICIVILLTILIVVNQ